MPSPLFFSLEECKHLRTRIFFQVQLSHVLRPGYELFIFFFKKIFWGSPTWHVISYLPNHGLNPFSLQWKYGVFTTGPPGKSSELFSFSLLSTNVFLVLICALIQELFGNEFLPIKCTHFKGLAQWVLTNVSTGINIATIKTQNIPSLNILFIFCFNVIWLWSKHWL